MILFVCSSSVSLFVFFFFRSDCTEGWFVFDVPTAPEVETFTVFTDSFQKKKKISYGSQKLKTSFWVQILAFKPFHQYR